MNIRYILPIILVFCSSCSLHKKLSLSNNRLELSLVEERSIFQSQDYYTWGASPIKGNDGKYHLFYSRWNKKYGFLAWVTSSEIAHAISDSAMGPYVFAGIALQPRGEEFWDGCSVHNPTIHYFDGKYYLYYMGTTGTSECRFNQLNIEYRNNQRIGVAVSESLWGPWERFDMPLIDVSKDSLAYDALMVSNPAITQAPDGSFLMVYKAVGKRKEGILGGPVVHLCATADSPLGPFKKRQKPIFTSKTSDFPAEDPYIWVQDGGYFAIVKDMEGSFTKAGRSLALFYSLDGKKWKPVKHPLISTTELHMYTGKTIELQHLERPQLLFEEGKPIILFMAADTLSSYFSKQTEDVNSFNVHIKIL